MFTSYYTSPIGLLKLSVTESSVSEVLFCNEQGDEQEGEAPTMMQECIIQLNEYFAGKRKVFELPLEQTGTSFQQMVWKELTRIPFGTTISYLELSRRIGNTKAIRAAAASNGKNKIAIIVPCHRVIGSGQNLVGYAGGLTKKRWLLDHECTFAHGLQTLF
jgi:methylated-DNA-[protein]-cysteine S-methyltransferase